MKNNPRVKLESILHKTVNRKKMKVWEFQSHTLSSFLAIKKSVTGVEGEGVESYFAFSIFVIIFVYTHEFTI